MSQTQAYVISNPVTFFDALNQAISELPGNVKGTIIDVYNANRGNAQELGNVLQAVGAGISAQQARLAK